VPPLVIPGAVISEVEDECVLARRERRVSQRKRSKSGRLLAVDEIQSVAVCLAARTKRKLGTRATRFGTSRPTGCPDEQGEVASVNMNIGQRPPLSM
jgi:hypothetical protein